jgi:hypothetical protein
VPEVSRPAAALESAGDGQNRRRLGFAEGRTWGRVERHDGGETTEDSKKEVRRWWRRRSWPAAGRSGIGAISGRGASTRGLGAHLLCAWTREREERVGRGWVEPTLGQADPVGLSLMGQFGLVQLDQSTLPF